MSHTHFAAFPAALALALLPACSGSKSGDDASGGNALRADAIVVADPGVQPAGVLEPIVADVAVDGDRIVVSIGLRDVSGCVTPARPTLAVSEDRGATWTTHVLPALPGTIASGAAGYLNCRIPVHTSGGRTAMLIGSECAIGGTCAFSWVYPVQVDLAQDTYSNPAQLTGTPGSVYSVTTRGSSFVQYACSQKNEGLWKWDLASSLPSSQYHPANGCEFGSRAVVTSSGFESYGLRGLAVNPQVTDWYACHFTNVFETQAHQAWCTPVSGVPGWDMASDSAAVLTSRGLLWPNSVGGAAWSRNALLMSIGPTGSPSILDMRSGHFELSLRGMTFRPRFGNLVALLREVPTVGGATRQERHLLDFKADGTVDEVTLPPTPCTGSGFCGYVMGNGTDWDDPLQWVVDLGGDEYLSLYVVNTGTTDVHDLVVATRDHATRATFTP